MRKGCDKEEVEVGVEKNSENKLGLSWAKLSSSWNWALL